MGKVSKDYQKIIAVLEDLKDDCSSAAGSKALQEAIDIISDYEKIVAGLNRMLKQYEQPEKPRKIGEGLYVCPYCGKRTQYNHSHCHWCGKRLGWGNK